MADGVFQLALRSTFALICCVSILPADIVVAAAMVDPVRPARCP